jgi:nitroreductase
MKREEFLKAMDFRHACKIFDESKKIGEDDMRYILECGRKSPSSFGQEGWKFLVITNDEIKERLRPLCWNQAQITSCSHLVVILAAIENLKPDSGEVAKRFQRRDLPKEKIDAYIELYGNFLKDTLSSDEKLYCWSARQCYIAAANMMTGAAFIGIDSCAIEGMDKEAVERELALDTKRWQVALLLPFGYRVKKQPSQVRLPFDEVVEYME